MRKNYQRKLPPVSCAEKHLPPSGMCWSGGTKFNEMKLLRKSKDRNVPFKHSSSWVILCRGRSGSSPDVRVVLLILWFCPSSFMYLLSVGPKPSEVLKKQWMENRKVFAKCFAVEQVVGGECSVCHFILKNKESLRYTGAAALWQGNNLRGLNGAGVLL